MVKPVIVVGSGFAGLSCAFHLAEAGIPVIILEKKEKLGGYFPQLKKQFPTNSCGVCFMHPDYPAYCPYIEAERHENITVYTNVSIQNIENYQEGVNIKFSADGILNEIDGQALVIATGYEPFDISMKPDLGGGLYENVYPALNFEDHIYDLIAENKSLPQRKIAYIQCVGSRDLKIKRPYCSSFCCMYAIKQALLIKDFDPDVDISIFYMDIRSFGKDYERYYLSAREKGIKFIRSAVASVKKRPSTGKLEVLYTKDGSATEETFDAVVLSQGAVIEKSILDLMKKLDVEIDFYKPKLFEDREIKRNIFVTGTLYDPMDIPDSAIDGIATASKIISRNMITPKILAPVKVKTQKVAKIGIFLLGCDNRLDDIVRTRFSEALKVKDLDEIQYAVRENKFDGAVIITDDIRKTSGFLENKNYCGLHIDSVVLVPSFNNALLEEISASIQKLRQVKRNNHVPKALNSKVCIIGGGLAGLVSAKFLGEMGINVVIVEKEDRLGGRLLEIPSRLDLVKNYIKYVEDNKNIEILLNSKVKDVEGRLGEYILQIESKEDVRKLKVDALLVTTGGIPRKNVVVQEDGKRVFTIFDFENRFDEISKSKRVVFKQCAGSRTEDNPVCYKVCCKKAVMSAIALKNKNPEIEIFILHKDIRTYGFSENLYRQARAMGIQFIRYSQEPEIMRESEKLKVKVLEDGTNSEFIFEPEYVLLSSGMNPNTEEVAEVLGIGTTDGFINPYNQKTGLLDIKNGIYSAGLCLAPNYTEDVIKQAEAVAVRIAIKLAGRQLYVKFNTAFVNPKYCCGCELCVKACPVSARYMDYEEKIARVDEALCEGCGNCAMVCANKASQHKVFEHKGMLKTIDLMVG
ncbi:MAG: FAD-dependent oxidoreductase [Proteobacteria bacterium]|nr:FAD-dependent oxidoreductase [Pseudomonadota bacterium]